MTLFRWLATATLALCLVVVVFGAYVRLSDAGLGCPDWPGCYGRLVVPTETAHVEAAAAQYPQRPLEHHKAWKEMIHRYLASTLGLLIVVMAFASRAVRDAPRVLPWALVGLVIFQGILGMWTVTWQLKPLAVTGHLLGGLSTLALLFWLRLSLGARAEPVETRDHGRREPRNELEAFQQIGRSEAAPAPARPAGLRPLATLGLVLLAGQIFLGGWTSSNYAALACPDLPTCQGSWWPELDLPEAFTLWRGLGVNYEYGVLDNRARVTIHHLHRVGAVVVATFLAVLGAFLWRAGGRWKAFGATLLVLLGAQVGIGLSLVLLHLPLPLAAAHNGGAALLLLAMVLITHRAWRPA